MPILYEISASKKDGHPFVMITGYEGKITDLIVPDTIEKLPVEAIGNHAFSGREDLVSVILPESVKTIYGFAFHNCRNLRKITLFDSIDDYYDGVCRQCDSLEEVEITVNNSWYEVIRNFLADSDKTLRFLIHFPENSDASENLTGKDKKMTSCLTFPEYVYDFNENTMARTIQFSIAGSGYAFRECVDRRRIDYRQYDSLFAKAVIDGGEIAENIAICRILYPVELEERYRLSYENYLRDNGDRVLDRLVKKASKEGNDDAVVEILKKLISYEKLFSGEMISKAISLAVSTGNTVLTATMMAESGPGNEQNDLDFVL